MPTADRLSDPAKITSSLFRLRSARPCSPSAQRSASARLLLPEPLGPTTALIPPPNSTRVRSANDLKPWRRSARSRAGGLIGASPDGPIDVGAGGGVGRRRSRRPDRLERLERGRGLRGPSGRPLPHP